MRTEKNINNPWGLKGEELRKYRDAVEASEQSYASYSEALNGVLYITPNTKISLLSSSQELRTDMFMVMRNDNSDSRKD